MRAEGENLSRARAHRMLLSSCRRVCEPARNSSHLRAMLEGSGQRAHICTGCMHWQLAPRPAHAHTSSTRTHQTVTNSARTRTRTHTLAYSAHTHACAPSHPLLLGVLDTHTHTCIKQSTNCTHIRAPMRACPPAGSRGRAPHTRRPAAPPWHWQGAASSPPPAPTARWLRLWACTLLLVHAY